MEFFSMLFGVEDVPLTKPISVLNVCSHLLSMTVDCTFLLAAVELTNQRWDKDLMKAKKKKTLEIRSKDDAY